MTLSTCCSLNPLPPSSTLDPSSSPSLITRTNLSRKSNERSSSSSSLSWSQKMMVIATTMVLSLEVGDIVSTNINGSYYNNAMASEVGMEFEIPKDKKEKKVARWSDKRSCPQWNMNSLETIVPENLPRPYFHRKWEKVSYSSNIMSPNSAPPIIEFLVRPKKACFSL